MNQYTELLQEIVLEMRDGLAQGRTDIPEPHFLLWRDFLKKIKPESELFQAGTESPLPREPSRDVFPDMPLLFDVREVMLLAESNGYPMWHIRPKPKEMVVLEYVQGRLRDSPESLDVGIPKTLLGFTGFIAGMWRSHSDGRKDFIACDVVGKDTVFKKIEFLKESGFSVVEHVLFPTEKIQTTSSTKLETFFRSYLSAMNEEGLGSDGIVILADRPIVVKENGESCIQFVFVPKS